uniref:Uncharacterized protein n=1 Tax=Quercus lobata TaxID=97700 RepID=A0A7N2MZD1_QUELO
MDENRIFCCGLDLSDFFERESLFRSSELSDPQILKRQRSLSKKLADSSSNFSRRSLDQGGSAGARTSRWVEFQRDAAVDRRQRNSSSLSSSSSERFFEMPRSEMPKWVEDLWCGFGFDLGISLGYDRDTVSIQSWKLDTDLTVDNTTTFAGVAAAAGITLV